MPACEPVKDTDGTPCSATAWPPARGDDLPGVEEHVHLPRFGPLVIFFDSSISPSVVLPIARSPPPPPSLAVLLTTAGHVLDELGVATELPPYFCTRMGFPIRLDPFARSSAPRYQ